MKISVSWSGGKDSAYALYRILQQPEYEIVGLHTVVDSEKHRVGLHGVPAALIEQQAAQIGLPLRVLHLHPAQEHGVYEALMSDFYRDAAAMGVEGILFGDIFLEDLRLYREKLLAPHGLKAVFPLWGEDSNELVRSFLQDGFKTILCAADSRYFNQDQLGKLIDERFLSALGPHVDPCGENGEFHTFVYDGPIFKGPVPYIPGHVEKHEYRFNRILPDGSTEEAARAFWFQDLQ